MRSEAQTMYPGTCFTSCISFMFGLTFTIIFLVGQKAPPTFHLLDIGIVNKSNVTFDLEIRNTNRFSGIEYEDLTVTLKDKRDSSAVVIPGFYQGLYKTAVKSEVVVGQWTPKNETISTRVWVHYKRKNKIWWIFTKTSESIQLDVASNDVRVDRAGKLINKRVQLVSSIGSEVRYSGFFNVVVGIVIVLMMS